MKPEDKKDSTLVYIPDNARLNFEAKNAKAPTVKHEKRRNNIHNNTTKKLCGGIYGRSDTNRG
jgi:hypothetical protein